MKKDYCFVRTIVLMDSYKEVEEVNGLTFAHFGAVKAEGADAYECAETSARTEDFDLEEAKAAYDEWKASMDALSLSHAKKVKIAEIEDYDQSDKVNGFSLNGMVVWLDKATRVGLMNSTNIAKAMGNETTTLWLGNVKLEVNCDMAIQLLSALEMYALECFNVTAAHKKTVEGLETIEEVEKFDVTEGYPSQLEMTV